MGFSSIAVQQREKEAEALRSFLAFSLIGSLALHLGVLTLGIGNLLHRTAELEEPLEVMIVEPPTLEAVKPQEETQQETQSSGGSAASAGSSGGKSGSEGGIAVVRSSSGGGSGTQSAPSSPPKAAVRALPKPTPSIAQTPETTSTPKPTQTSPPEVTAAPKPVITPSPQQSVSPQPAPTLQTAPVAVNRSPQNLKPAAPAQPQQQDNEKLRDFVTGIRNSRASQGSAPNSLSEADNPSRMGDTLGGLRPGTQSATGGSGNRTGSGGSSTGNSSSRGSGTGTGNGSGQGTGTGTGNSPGSGSQVAAGPRSVRQGTPRGEGSGNGDPTGSGSGRLACRNCSKPKYPERARRQGQEGTAKISVDVDAKGNVTNVRLTGSSGHTALDEAALREARRWKFDAPNGARQGLSAKVDFALEESERARRASERRRRREASRKKRSSETQNATKKPAAQTTAERSTSTRRAVRTKKQPSQLRPAQPASTPSPRREATAPKRRRVRISSPNRAEQATPSSPSKLRQSLRRSRQESQQPASLPKPANSAPNGHE